jgi:hypothetical protein
LWTRLGGGVPVSGKKEKGAQKIPTPLVTVLA